MKWYARVSAAGDIAVESCDVLVIGSGAAGLRAAISARSDPSIDVLVVSKCAVASPHSVMAEGGISVALGLADPEDDAAQHRADTLLAGRYLNDPELVDRLVTEAPKRVQEAAAFGALFDREAQTDSLVQRRGPGGGHTRSRALIAGDYIGFALLTGLLKESRRRGVRMRSDLFILDLIHHADAVRGATAIDLRTGRPFALLAGATVLASGGAGQLYAITTNPAESTGDGYAIALRRGLQLRDMEQVQFHPTAGASPREARGLLVTESMRGHGAVLRNVEGERFMYRYDPERMELSYRDVVARAQLHRAHRGALVTKPRHHDHPRIWAHLGDEL